MYPLTKDLIIKRQNSGHGGTIYFAGETYIGFVFNHDPNAKSIVATLRLYSEDGKIVEHPASGTLELNNERLVINGVVSDRYGDPIQPEREGAEPIPETGLYDEIDLTANKSLLGMINVLPNEPANLYL